MLKESIKQVLMKRDNLTEKEAEKAIDEARKDLYEKIRKGDMSAHDICQDHFGLEPDYLLELL